MLSRVLVALGLAAAVVSTAAVMFLRTDFVGNNLCAYAVATIEEATAARVQVSQCSVEPEQGKLTIEGLRVGDPGGRIELEVVRVFAQVKVRPLLQKVRFERLEVDHPRLRLALDQAGASPPSGGQCLPDVLDRFEFGRVKIRKASVDVRTAGGTHVGIPRAALAVRGRGGQLSVAVSTRGGAVELPGRTIGLISSRTAALVDLRGTGAVELRRADVIGTEASAFVKGKLQNLCDPQIEAAANLRVDDLETATARLMPGTGGIKGGISADAIVSLGRGAPHLRGDVRLKSLALAQFFPGDAKFRFDLTPARLRVDRLEVPVGRGQVGGSIDVALADATLPLSADLQLREMELPELLHKLGLHHAWIQLRATGRVQAKGTLAPFQLSGDTALDLAEFAVLDRSYEKRPQARKMLEFARGKLTGQVLADPEKIVAQGVAIEVGAASGLQVESTFFTDTERGMQLAAHSERLALEDLRGHLGPLPAGGILKLAATVSGPYRALSIEGRTAAQDAQFMDLALGDLTTHVSFDTTAMKLAFAEIKAHKDRSSYQGRIAVDFSAAAMPLDAHVELQDAYLNDLVDLAVGLVPSLRPVEDPDVFDGHVEGVIDVKGPALAPAGTASLQLDDLNLWGESFEAGTARLSMPGGDPRLRIDELILRHGEATLVGSGRFGPQWQLDMDAHTENFTLADLDPLQRARLSGPMQLSAHAGGVASHPRVDVSLRFKEGMADEADLGDGDLSLTLDGLALAWKATVGAHGIHGQARLEGDFPYSCSGTLRVADLPQYVDLVAPDFDIDSGSLTAAFDVHGSLLRWRESAGTMTVSELKIVRSDLPFENDGPAQVSFGPDGFRSERLALRAPFTSAQLSGGRARDGKLDLQLKASIDGRVLPGLMADVGHASGTYLVQATVGGTAKSPVVLGNIRIEDGAVSLRGLPVAARSLNGSISFSQDALVIDSLSGKLNNGEARVSGGIEMERLVPKKIDMSAHVSDVNVRFQESAAAMVDGDLTLYGPPLEPVLGGNLVLSQLKYTEDIEVEKSLLDFSRRPPTPKVLTKSPIVVHFDLDVHLGRGVRVENNLARTDLKGDLKLTGTSRSIGLLGSMNTVHGTASFRGNEFQIEQGVLTFTDRQRIRPSFDFQASSQVKSGNVDYKIRLHAFGTPGEPHVTLSSEPALAEADLGFLLTFGFVSQNLQQSTFSAADSGLAIGIEALNKATGFSDEVRRFIPKNAILRNPNIDFASDFSATTNRLEPMARFQSQLITERLELKVLEGLTTRRYRGVISYQLSDSISTRFQLDNEHITTGLGTDFGIDLHLRWEGE